MPGFRDLARNHDFQRLWIGETVNEVGTGLSLFALPLVAYALWESSLLAAAAETTYLIGQAAALLPAGVLADRLNRRRLMMSCSAVGLASWGSVALAMSWSRLSFGHLLASALIAGVAAGCMSPAFISALRSVVPTDQLPTAMSQTQARHHIAGLIGGPLAGTLYAVTRWLPFAADAVTFAVSFVMVSRVRTDLSTVQPAAAATEAAPPRPGLWHSLMQGLRFVWGWPFFRTLMVWSALINTLTYAVSFVIVISQVREGWPPWAIGVASTAGGIGGLLGAAAAPWIIERTRTGWLTVSYAWAAVLPLIPLIWTSHPAVVSACVFTLMLLSPVGNAGISAYRIAQTPLDLQGRASSATQFCSMSVMPLGPLMGGALLDQTGRTAAMVMLIISTLFLAALLTSSHAIRAVPRPSDWGEARPSPAVTTDARCS